MVRAVVLNSGGANACTGPQGFQDTHATAEHVAAARGGSALIGAGEVAVCSTGLIGERLPMDKLLPGVDAAVAGAGRATAAPAAAEAIMTTDTGAEDRRGRPATAGRVGGMAKGAGMLAPGAGHHARACSPPTRSPTPARSTRRCARPRRVTFDRLDSDGCMSTNDTVLLLASGASGRRADPGRADRRGHRGLPRPGPAAARRRRGRHQGHRDRGASARPARTTRSRSAARSPATTWSRRALFGNDPNWGRILAAVGTTDAAFEPDRLDVAINGVWVCRAGAAGRGPVQGGPAPAATCTIADRPARRRGRRRPIRTNDLSHAYVHENSAYST